jgi:hypothetical protein
MVSQDAVLAEGKLGFLRDSLPSDVDHYPFQTSSKARLGPPPGRGLEQLAGRGRDG